MALPTNLGTGTITATAIDNTGAVVTGIGPTFTPSFATPALDPTASGGPLLIKAQTVASKFDNTGKLKAADGTSALVLMANQDQDINPPDWNWLVNWSGVSGFEHMGTYPINLPQSTTVDLGNATPVGQSNGAYITQGPPGPTGPPVSTDGATVGQVYTLVSASTPGWATPSGGGGSAVTVNGVAAVSGDIELTKANFPDVTGQPGTGLDQVDNTHDNAKHVAQADKLATPRTISLTGEATGSANFDGSANVTLNVSGISAGGGGAWGGITGTLASQTDLQTALNGKQDASALPTALLGITGYVTFVIRSGTAAWPARPTSNPNVLVFWIGAGDDPARVTSGTGGMYDNDLRFVIGG